MADWVTLTVELEGCEPIDCRVEVPRREYAYNSEEIYFYLKDSLKYLSVRATELIESRGYGRKA